MLPMWRIGAKYDSKNQNLKSSAFDSSRRACHFSVFGRQNQIKMAELYPFKVGAKVACWHILGLKLAISATFFEILSCPSFRLILKGKPSWKSIEPKLTILALKNTKMAISQNPIFPKWRSPKSILLLHFIMKFSETFKIDVNMDLANTNHGGFLI